MPERKEKRELANWIKQELKANRSDTQGVFRESQLPALPKVEHGNDVLPALLSYSVLIHSCTVFSARQQHGAGLHPEKLEPQFLAAHHMNVGFGNWNSEPVSPRLYGGNLIS